MEVINKSRKNCIFKIILLFIYVHNTNCRVIIYNQGLTTAVVTYGREGVIEKCQLHMEDTEDRPKPILGLTGINVTKLDFPEMLKVLKQCHELKENKSEITKFQLSAVFRGIVPGTMWCGLNDIAKDYNQLGPERELDKCCRTHDHCPIRIQPTKRRFGLWNLSLYTKSHCECDDFLYNCLKAANSTESDLIGNLYFNFIKVQCVSKIETRECNRNCKNTSTKKNYKFVNVRHKWNK